MPKADANSHMIACYGTEEDRQRLLLVAEAAEMTMSAWLVGKIREAYGELHGETPPNDIPTTVRERSWGRFSKKRTANA